MPQSNMTDSFSQLRVAEVVSFKLRTQAGNQPVLAMKTFFWDIFVSTVSGFGLHAITRLRVCKEQSQTLLRDFIRFYL